jgi:hypothetical protein
MKRPRRKASSDPPALRSPLEGIIDLESFGQALLHLEVTRIRTPVRAPPTLFTDRVSISLGNGQYTMRHAKLARTDLKHLAKVVSESGKEVVELANLLTRGDLKAARAIAEKIGLTEDEFVAAGGGWIGLAILLIVVLISLPGDSPVPTAKDKAQSFTIDKKSDDLMDGVKK